MNLDVKIFTSQNKYNCSYDVYKNKAEAIVEAHSQFLRFQIDQGVDKTELFFRILTSLGSARHALALECNTIQADLYGKQRFGESFSSISCVTPLESQYKNYNTN